jgi:hypothetical protein
VSTPLGSSPAGRTQHCAAGASLLFSGVYVRRQVPTPSAAAWLLDLTERGGPLLVVLRRESDEAIATAVGHLLDADLAADPAQARELVADVKPQLVAVTW